MAIKEDTQYRIPKRYDKIFSERGGKYHDAMVAFPSARDIEFSGAFENLEIAGIQTVLDIPSGGSYLHRFFPNAEIYAVEFSDGFQSPNSTVEILDIESFQLPHEEYDLAMTIASLHHIENRESFTGEVFASVKPDGFYCIADVVENSKIASFLDGFVGRYNGTGHEGMFLSACRDDNLDWLPDGSILEHQVKPCPWRFTAASELTQFVRSLFSLSGVSDREIMHTLENEIGITHSGDELQLDWELLYIVLKKVSI